jgi:hypothetical protein
MGRLGDIFRAHGDAYRARFVARMSVDQRRAMRAIATCHTPAAGAVLWHCSDCGREHFTFQGCGNRHCPACGRTDAEQWLRKQSALLLPGVTYHLVTFTVPEKLRRTIRSHPRELLDLLIKTASSTLQDLCGNDKWIGGRPGMTAVLHTWTRQLEYHPHVHVIVTGGGLDTAGQWHRAHPKYLVPVQALSKVFRARLRDALKEQHADMFAQIQPAVWRDGDWVVHSKPVGSGEKAYQYLARYVYRVALCESAILDHSDECVVVRYRHSGTNRPRTLRLKPEEFLRRFLQHVLPSRFCKVRHYGLHHSSKRQTVRTLQAAMALALGQPMPQPPPEDEPSHVPACPQCEAAMVFATRLTLGQWQTRFAGHPHAERGPP